MFAEAQGIRNSLVAQGLRVLLELFGSPGSKIVESDMQKCEASQRLQNLLGVC